MTFLMNGYEMIVGVTVLILSCTTMIVVFEHKYKLLWVIFALFLMTAMSVVWRHIMNGTPFDWHAAPTFFHLAVFICMLKGLAFQKVFIYFMQYILLISQWYLVEAVSGIFVDSESILFSQINTLILVAMFSAYMVLMVKKGQIFTQRLLSYGHKPEWVFYAFGAGFSFILMTISYDFPGSTIQYIMVIIFVVWSFGVFCYAIINAHERTKKAIEVEYAAGIISTGRDYYQKMELLDTQIRIMRHDMKYHLTVLQGLLTSGKESEMNEYLSTVEETLSEQDIPKYCTNSVVNALLTSYAERCGMYSIKYETEILLPEKHSISNYEICIIVGNLLENAVEACRKISAEGAWIELRLKPLGEQLVIRIRNSYSSGDLPMNKQLSSNRKEGRGLGLKSVQTIAAKYGGDLIIDCDKNIFTVYVAVML